MAWPELLALGRRLYAKQCASCHTPDKGGKNLVLPAASEVEVAPAAAPGIKVGDNVTLILRSGRKVDGKLARASADAITLDTADGENTILRADVEQLIRRK